MAVTEVLHNPVCGPAHNLHMCRLASHQQLAAPARARMTSSYTGGYLLDGSWMELMDPRADGQTVPDVRDLRKHVYN